jgi:alkylhydroperoxidase family enzyme
MEAAERLKRLSSAATALTRAVLESAADTSREVRREAFDGSVRDAGVAGYVALVEREARLVTDSQLTQLRQEGLSEDAIFEVTAAAVGAARRRFDAGVAMLQREGGL